MNADELPLEVLCVLVIIGWAAYGIVRLVQRAQRIRAELDLIDEAGRAGTLSELIPTGHDGGDSGRAGYLPGMGAQGPEDRVPDHEIQGHDGSGRSERKREDEDNERFTGHARSIHRRIYESPRPGGPIPSIVERLDRWNP